MDDNAEPERRLALAYAPARARAALETLWRLDARLGDAIAASGETGIRLIRLAWWREALAALDTRPPPAEPLLTEIAAVILPRGVSGAMLSLLEDGWSPLADGPPYESAVLIEHAETRGRTLFALAAKLLGEPDGTALARAGEGWGLIDVMRRLPEGEARTALRDEAGVRLVAVAGLRWSRALRPLGVLVALARRDAAAAVPERAGAPARVLRALRMGLTGR